jgi:hypothetical protein
MAIFTGEPYSFRIGKSRSQERVQAVLFSGLQRIFACKIWLQLKSVVGEFYRPMLKEALPLQ